MKKTLVILALVMFLGTFASAQVAFSKVADQTATINVHATIQQSASIILSTKDINFDVQNPGQATNAKETVKVTTTVSLAKGYAAFMTIYGTDLVGKEAANIIPVSSLLVKTPSSGFTPLTNDPYMWMGFTINTNTGGLVNHSEDLPLSFQLAPVQNYVPDQYTGTVTILLQVA